MKNKEIVIDTRLNTILFDNTKYYDVPKEILSYIRELEKDNKDLDRENQILFETNLNLQNNRDKAIRTLESLKGSARWERHLYEVDYMLDILKGGNNGK